MTEQRPDLPATEAFARVVNDLRRRVEELERRASSFLKGGSMSGDLNVNGDLAVTGDGDVAGTLTADLLSVLTDLNVAGATVLADTQTGILTVNANDEATTADGTGALQVGTNGAPNLGIDGNEIQARGGGGGASGLNLNPHGGTLFLGGDVDFLTNTRSIRFTEGGPNGLEQIISSALESALYYRTTPRAWQFEDGAANVLLGIYSNDGRIAIPTGHLEITGSNDVGASGGGHIQLGTHGSSLSLGLDTNEMQAWNNAAASGFHVNPFGGDVRLSGGSLHVDTNGNINLNATEPQIRFGGTDMRWFRESGEMKLMIDSADYFRFRAGSATQARLVGVPNNLYLANNDTASSAEYLLFDGDNSRLFGYVNGKEVFRWDDSVTPLRMSFAQGWNDAGTGGPGSNALYYVGSGGRVNRSTSRRAAKRDIRDIFDWEADQVLKLRPVRYRAAHPDERDWSHYGFIAEEVADIQPRFASWDMDAEKPAPSDVNYARLTVPLVHVAQRLRADLDAAQAEIADLQAEIADLRETIDVQDPPNEAG